MDDTEKLKKTIEITDLVSRGFQRTKFRASHFYIQLNFTVSQCHSYKKTQMAVLKSFSVTKSWRLLGGSYHLTAIL